MLDSQFTLLMLTLTVVLLLTLFDPLQPATDDVVVILFVVNTPR